MSALVARLETAFALANSWPVDSHGIAVIAGDDTIMSGDILEIFRIASVSKLLTAWAVHVAVEEGSTSLRDPVGQDGCTVEHLLAHAGGYSFDGLEPISSPGKKRIYSNTGYEMLARHLEQCTGIEFAEYLHEAVFSPLGMHNSELVGSPAKDVNSTVADLALFAAELRSPTLIARDTHARAVSTAFPGLDGIVPGVGRFAPCPWGLGPEIKSHKHPHWTGDRNSASTYGHFGGSGTFLWVDPLANVACVMLAHREFDEWGMQCWPQFSDAVLAACE